ncbi:MAG: type II toxin-antitoxin system VapC family toxin [Chitinophagales bacterium]
MIDTNVVSDYFSFTLPDSGMKFMDKVVDEVPKLSIISQIELLCWKTEKSTTQKVKSFIADSLILDISQGVINHCVEIRKNRKIKTPDAIIAGTALDKSFILLTRNTKDFQGIPGLDVLNPHEL